MTVSELFRAVQQQAGRFADAERLYRAIIAWEPRHGDALHCLGALLHQNAAATPSR